MIDIFVYMFGLTPVQRSPISDKSPDVNLVATRHAADPSFWLLGQSRMYNSVASVLKSTFFLESFGVPVYGCTAAPVYRCTCLLVYLFTRVQVYRCTGVQVYLCSGVPVCLCTGVLMYRCAGVSVYRCACVAGVLVHW